MPKEAQGNLCKEFSKNTSFNVLRSRSKNRPVNTQMKYFGFIDVFLIVVLKMDNQLKSLSEMLNFGPH